MRSEFEGFFVCGFVWLFFLKQFLQFCKSRMNRVFSINLKHVGNHDLQLYKEMIVQMRE